MRQLKISTRITDKESQSIDGYLAEIRGYKLITPDEEFELMERRDKGDPAAVNELVKANLRFVVSVAKQYINNGLKLGDLIGEGNIGLIKAAQKFDATKGFKFISYAVWWIRQSILQALQNTGKIIRLPGDKAGLHSKMIRAIEKFEHENSRSPTDDELSEILNTTLGDIKLISPFKQPHTSLGQPAHEESDDTMEDLLVSDEADTDHDLSYSESLNIDIRRVISRLNATEQFVIKALYGIDMEVMNIDDIADKYDYTRERIRQIKQRVIKKLKSPKSKNLLQKYNNNAFLTDQDNA